jgi:hypothetical protein
MLVVIEVGAYTVRMLPSEAIPLFTIFKSCCQVAGLVQVEYVVAISALNVAISTTDGIDRANTLEWLIHWVDEELILLTRLTGERCGRDFYSHCYSSPSDVARPCTCWQEFAPIRQLRSCARTTRCYLSVNCGTDI